MCQAFSCIVKKSGKVYWKAGMDSHDTLIEEFGLRGLDRTQDPQEMLFARVEITPDKGYLYPEGEWTLKIDEQIKPIWWTPYKENRARKALEKWKAVVYQFNLDEARNPINPLRKIIKPTKEDIALLREWVNAWDSVRDSVWDTVWDIVGNSVGDSVWASVWASVGASVGDSVGASVGDSVWASVWASVRAYIGSLFPNIVEWKYINHVEGEYPYQSCVDLWRRGLVPSFDGKTWRLHSGRKATIVYQEGGNEDGDTN